MTMDFRAYRAGTAHKIFSECADISRCFQLIPAPDDDEQSEASVSHIFNPPKIPCTSRYHVTFSPRSSVNADFREDAQCDFGISLDSPADLSALDQLFSQIVEFNDRVEAGQIVGRARIEPTIKGEIYGFTASAYCSSWASSVVNSNGQSQDRYLRNLRTLVHHFNFGLMIKGSVRHVGTFTLNAGMKTVLNIAHDLAVIRALLDGVPEDKIRAMQPKKLAFNPTISEIITGQSRLELVKG
ncbi:hypothetical protein [Pseudomonas sp. PLMAX]|uniref:hypothetical protein n=1 Tax=Pseudomonas sp. PLMAX TaxID=2201998 RepID=UPI0038B7DB9A